MRQTQLNENGEGLPRYGNPTSTLDIAGDTGWTRDQIDRRMRKLVRTQYIRTVRRGNDGVVIFIQRAKKKQKVTRTGSAKTAEPNTQVPLNQRSQDARFRESQGTHDANQPKNQTVARFPTKSLSYSETSSYSNTDAAAKTAADDFLSLTGKELAKQETLPKGKSYAELDERRRFLLKQSEEIKARYGAHP